MQEREPCHMTQPCLTLEEIFKLLPTAAVPSSSITPKAQVTSLLFPSPALEVNFPTG